MILLLTNSAKTRLLELTKAIKDFNPVISIGSVKGGTASHIGTDKELSISPIEAGWGIGLYDLAKLSPNKVTVISGLNFLIDEDLDGFSIDFKENHFLVARNE